MCVGADERSCRAAEEAGGAGEEGCRAGPPGERDAVAERFRRSATHNIQQHVITVRSAKHSVTSHTCDIVLMYLKSSLTQSLMRGSIPLCVFTYEAGNKGQLA